MPGYIFAGVSQRCSAWGGKSRPENNGEYFTIFEREEIHIFIPQCNHILLYENSAEKDLFSITTFERE